MNIGLAIESDSSVEHLIPMVRKVNQMLKACFETNEYGADLVYIAIGVILTADTPLSRRFHSQRPFEYKRLDRIKHPGTGRVMEFHNSASWDVKPDIGAISGMEMNAARDYLCETLIASTGCLEEHRSQFPDFDVARFRVDFEACLRVYCATKN